MLLISEIVSDRLSNDFIKDLTKQDELAVKIFSEHQNVDEICRLKDKLTKKRMKTVDAKK